MKRIMRLFAIVGLMSVLLPSSTLAEVVQYKGARLGYTSDTDIVFDIPAEMSCEDLLTLSNGFYKRWLQPYERESFTVAQRRLLLICCYVNLCHWSAFWTGLVCKYERDTKELDYNCGAPAVGQIVGYLVDSDKFYRIRNAFSMNAFSKTEEYRRYIQRVNEILFSEMFKDEGKSIPTDADKAIFSKVLSDVAWNRSTDLRFLEEESNKDAVGWNEYCFLLRNDKVGIWWLDLRRYYQEMKLSMENYERTFVAQTQIQHDALETERIAHTLAREWMRDIGDCRKRLQWSIYDAPYCLFVTNFCKILEPASGFFPSDQQKNQVSLYFGDFRNRLGNSEDVMSNLAATLSVTQTSRLIKYLKDKMGTSAYNALIEQNRVLKEMQEVGNRLVN